MMHLECKGVAVEIHLARYDGKEAIPRSKLLKNNMESILEFAATWNGALTKVNLVSTP